MTNPPFKVKAVYDYNSPHEDDLSFLNGQIITVTEVEDDDWYVGEYTDASGLNKDGLFPKNFVETYEPEPPPRPIRGARVRNTETTRDTKIKNDGEDTTEQTGNELEQDKAGEIELKQQNIVPVQNDHTTAVSSEQSEPKEEVPARIPGPPPPAPKPAPAVPATTKGPPSVIAEKPSSFKDRIAAFNKPAAPPVPSLKPTNAPTGFIKKPFVAPPPSRNAYIPPQKDNPPPKPVIREDIPENSQTKPDEQARQESHDSAGVSSERGQDEEAPKSTSLKERIALLQKQQLEQAARRADQSQKEKPRKPSKKNTDSSERSDGPNENTQENEKFRTSEDSSRLYTQQIVESPTAQDGAGDKKLETGDRDIHNEGYNADQSGAGELTGGATGNSASIEEDDRRDIEVQQTKEGTSPPTNGAESSEEEDDDMDPETRRRMELRERMAKMSGGMGMPGMFNPFGGTAMGGMPPKKKTSEKSTEKSETQASAVSQESRPVPMVPVPGISSEFSTPAAPELSSTRLDNEDSTQDRKDYTPSDDLRLDDNQDEHQRSDGGAEEYQDLSVTASRPSTSRDPPPIPTMSRPVAEAQPSSDPPEMLQSRNAGAQSDDEMSTYTRSMTRHESVPTPQKASLAEKSQAKAEHAQSPSSPEISSVPDASHSSESYQKRRSRPPPIPRSDSGAEVITQSNNRRPPPPPPPTQVNAPPAIPPLSRQSMSDVMASDLVARRSSENKASQQSYDTRQETPEFPQRHSRDSYDYKSEITAAENTISSPVGMANKEEQTFTGHRAAPPPLPGQVGRKSVELSRAPPSLPPPIPLAAAPPLPSSVNRQHSLDQNTPIQGSPSQNVYTPRQELGEEELYASSPIRRSTEKSAFSHAKSPINPSSSHLAVGQASPRPSNEFSQMYGGIGRKSMDHSRNLNEQEYIASDVDLGISSKWWIHSKGLPPIFRDRNDILYEFEESTASAKNTSTVSKSLYILFRDYSQTIIDVEFDARNVQDVRLEQRHEQPPPRLREDQLEEAHSKIGLRLSDAVTTKQNTVVGDGSPQALILDLLNSMPSVLKPVGTRAYGALVYANRANATVEQHDEIRAGDIVTLRNAKLQGKHGPMHQKYSIEVGKPDHVGIVVDWDGTKKKIRAWEQGRESKKVKIESYKIGDLKIGEVRVWRLMSRSWVGWGSNS